MGLFLDFRRPEGRDVQRLEALAACYQSFVGHELPNALVALQGFARLVPDEPPDEARDLLARMAALARKADRCSRRLAEIGRLMRAPQGKLTVSLADAVREAGCRAFALHPASPLALGLQEPMPRVTADRELLDAALVEVLANACRSVPAGERCPVEATAAEEEEGVWLTLSDSGRGMDAAQLARLDEPFAAGRKAGADGFGLGFFLVRQAAAKWGGAVRVGSDPGRGTSVALFFPLAGGR